MTRINIVFNLETPEELEELAKALKTTLTFQEIVRRQQELDETKLQLKELEKEVSELMNKRKKLRKELGIEKYDQGGYVDTKEDAEDEANEERCPETYSPSMRMRTDRFPDVTEEALTTPENPYEGEAQNEQDRPEREESNNR